MGMVSKRFSAGGADAPSFLGHHLSLGPLGVALLHGKYNTNLPPPPNYGSPFIKNILISGNNQAMLFGAKCNNPHP